MILLKKNVVFLRNEYEESSQIWSSVSILNMKRKRIIYYYGYLSTEESLQYAFVAMMTYMERR